MAPEGKKDRAVLLDFRPKTADNAAELGRDGATGTGFETAGILAMRRLGILHTAPLLVDVFKTLLADRYPDLDSFHVLDESLVRDARRFGGVTPSIVRRLMVHCQLACDAGAEVILVTCSSIAPAIDTVRDMIEVPVIKIDDAMASRAVSIGSRIGLVCTSKAAVAPSELILTAHARARKAAIAITRVIADDARAALRDGDRAGHDAAVIKAATGIAGAVDVIVLAEASLAPLARGPAESLNVPVLGSPEICVDALASVL